MFLTYIALIHKADKKSAPYGVIFPDFPGCLSAGNTLDEALKNARSGLIFHMQGMLDSGEVLPEPTSLDIILSMPEYHQAIPAMVHLIPPSGHLKRVNISVDAGLLAEIDQAAKLLGKNRSEFLIEAAREMLA